MLTCLGESGQAVGKHACCTYMRDRLIASQGDRDAQKKDHFSSSLYWNVAIQTRLFQGSLVPCCDLKVSQGQVHQPTPGSWRKAPRGACGDTMGICDA